MPMTNSVPTISLAGRKQIRAWWVKKGLTEMQAKRVERLQHEACVHKSEPQWLSAITWGFDRLDEKAETKRRARA